MEASALLHSCKTGVGFPPAITTPSVPDVPAVSVRLGGAMDMVTGTTAVTGSPPAQADTPRARHTTKKRCTNGAHEADINGDVGKT